MERKIEVVSTKIRPLRANVGIPLAGQVMYISEAISYYLVVRVLTIQITFVHSLLVDILHMHAIIGYNR